MTAASHDKSKILERVASGPFSNNKYPAISIRNCSMNVHEAGNFELLVPDRWARSKQLGLCFPRSRPGSLGLDVDVSVFALQEVDFCIVPFNDAHGSRTGSWVRVFV